MDNSMRYYRNRQGQKGKVVIVDLPLCSCGEVATLSKTVDGKVKRTCSVHWHTPQKQEKQATTELLKTLGLLLSS
jgi:hypothetical protein